jgi:hypothetical protein
MPLATICQQILFRNFKTGAIAIAIPPTAIAVLSPAKGGDALCSPVLSPGKGKVSSMSGILTIYVGIVPFGKGKGSPGRKIRFPHSQKVSFGK